MSLTQKGIVSVFMFIFLNSLSVQEVQKDPSISPLSKLAEKI